MKDKNAGTVRYITASALNTCRTHYVIIVRAISGDLDTDKVAGGTSNFWLYQLEKRNCSKKWKAILPMTVRHA